MDLGLKGRTAVISGGSKGIGKAIARVTAREFIAHCEAALQKPRQK